MLPVSFDIFCFAGVVAQGRRKKLKQLTSLDSLPSKKILKKKHPAANKGDTRPPGEDESVDLHFVAFVESGGRLWELDGLKVAPVDHGATTKDTLLKDAAGAITREFVQNETAEGSINFNLLALVGGGGGGVDE